MENVTVKLDNQDKIKQFNDAAIQLVGEVDIISGRYVIDGKSLLGIYSLNLSKDLTLNIHTSEEEKKSFLESIKNLLV